MDVRDRIISGRGVFDTTSLFKRVTIKESNNKYIPHQGSRERFRRLERIYRSHPHDCPCKSCEMMDSILKSKGIME